MLARPDLQVTVDDLSMGVAPLRRCSNTYFFGVLTEAYRRGYSSTGADHFGCRRPQESELSSRHRSHTPLLESTLLHLT